MNSYALITLVATIRRKLANIGTVAQRGLTWVVLGVIGTAGYWLLLVILHNVFRLDLTAMLVATLIAVLVAAFIYKLRGYLLVTRGKAVQEQSYYYRQALSDLASKIHNVSSLRQQSEELLMLVTKAVGCKQACLLFSDAGSEDFTTQSVEPKGEDNPLSSLRLRGRSLIVKYLGREQKPLTRENLATLPDFRGLCEQEKEAIKSNEIELFVPLISHDRVIGILVLDKSNLANTR